MFYKIQSSYFLANSTTFCVDPTRAYSLVFKSAFIKAYKIAVHYKV